MKENGMIFPSASYANWQIHKFVTFLTLTSLAFPSASTFVFSYWFLNVFWFPPPCYHCPATSSGIDHFSTGLLIPVSRLPIPLFFTLYQGFLPTCRLGHTLPSCQNTKPVHGFTHFIKNSTPLLGIRGHLTIFCPTACLHPSPTNSAPYSNLLSRWIIHPTLKSL